MKNNNMFLNEVIDSVIGEMDKIRFVGMKRYRLGVASCVQIRELFDTRAKISYKNIIVRALCGFAFKTYEYKESRDQNANMLFLYSHSYCGRKDHQSSFEKIASLVTKKHVLIAFSMTHKFSLRNLSSVFCYFIWLFQMRSIQIPVRAKLYLSAYFIGFKEWAKYCECNIQPKDYRALVTFCDMHSFDNLIAQYFNMAGVNTVTLQHATGTFTYSVPVNTNDISKITLVHYTESMHLLVWGNKLRSALIEYGMPPEKLVTLGCIKYVLQPFVNFESEKGKFGVVLSKFNKDDINHKNNTELIKIANEHSKKLGMPYILRMHPYNYRNYMELLPIVTEHLVSKSDQTIEDFAKHTEFIISDEDTTVVAEMVYLERVILLYEKKKLGESQNPYGLKSFESLSELETELDQISSDITKYKKWIGNIKTQFMGSGDITSNYQKYFDNLRY